MMIPENGWKQHRFSFGDCCVAVSERLGSSKSELALFFLHGRFGQGETWLPIVERLFPQFPCFSIDLPGFGQSFSSRERGLSLLEHAHIVRHLIEGLLHPHQKAVVIGHDIGGAIAQLTSLEIRLRLAGIVLINGSGLSEPVYGIKTGWFGWSARWRLSRLLGESRFLEKDQEWRMTVPWKVRTSRDALVRAMRAFEMSWPGPFERQFWRREIRNLSAPVLLLWGTRDAINPMENGLRLVRDLPEAYFYEQDDAGHWPQLEAPEWVSGKIQEFAFKVMSHREPLRKVIG